MTDEQLRVLQELSQYDQEGQFVPQVVEGFGTFPIPNDVVEETPMTFPGLPNVA